MTYHAPTETNPPFTTPPTWPFPTSSADWEPDYRLRLLETALVYMWTNGSGPGPPGPVGPQGPAGPAGPATAGLYAAVGTAQPPTNGSTIVPPEGFFWVDTSTSQVNPLPPPLTSGQPFTTYTDPYGKIWVAKGGVNGGAWKDPRDVLHTAVARNAIYTLPAVTSVPVPFDTVQNDPYGIWTPGNNSFQLPIAGIYQFSMGMYFQAAGNQYIQLVINSSAVRQTINSAGQGNMVFPFSSSWKCNANDLAQCLLYSNTASATGTSTNYCWMSVDYLGTG